jgi:surfactin synthase thioesterase subunit
MIEEIQARFGPIPEVLLREQELLARFLVPLRADLEAVERHVHLPGPTVRCALTAVGGRHDPDVTETELRAWSEVTSGPFEAALLDAGHFFLDRQDFRDLVVRTLP